MPALGCLGGCPFPRQRYPIHVPIPTAAALRCQSARPFPLPMLTSLRTLEQELPERRQSTIEGRATGERTSSRHSGGESEWRDNCGDLFVLCVGQGRFKSVRAGWKRWPNEPCAPGGAERATGHSIGRRACRCLDAFGLHFCSDRRSTGKMGKSFDAVDRRSSSLSKAR